MVTKPTKESQKGSFWKRLKEIWGKEIKINIKDINDFDAWIKAIRVLMKKNEWWRALKFIEKVKENEKKDSYILLEKTIVESNKEIIRKNHSIKLESLNIYEKEINEKLKLQQNENKLKIVEQKILYITNRIKYLLKNKDYTKALSMLNAFYEQNKNEAWVVNFYNKEKIRLENISKWNTWILRFFKKKNSIEIKKEEKIISNDVPLIKIDEIENKDNLIEVTETEKVIEWSNDVNIENKKNVPNIENEAEINNKIENNIVIEESKNTNELEISKDNNQSNINNVVNIKNIKPKLWISKKYIDWEESKNWDNEIKNEPIEKEIVLWNEKLIIIDDKDKGEKSVFEETKFLNEEIGKEEEQEVKKLEQSDLEEKLSFFERFILWKKSNLERLNTKVIRNFEQALKSIKFFIDIKDWKKAKKWIEEIKSKEEIALNDLISKVRIEEEQEKQRKIYNTKLERIWVLEDLLDQKERAYNQKIQEEKFKTKFVWIKQKIDDLIWKKQNYEALELITKFFEENQNVQSVVAFFNKEKNRIQKIIEKTKAREEKEVAKSTKKEALSLIWEFINLWWENVDNVDTSKKNLNKSEILYFFKQIKDKFNIAKRIKKKLIERQLIDEVTILLESEAEINEATKIRKLENMHTWLIKEVNNDKLLWYEFYAKILWKDKISWDTFWFLETDKNYKFFLWDATWHWVQAWLIVTLLTRLFTQFAKSSILEKLVLEINNWLKQDLKSRNFITWLFYEVDKKNLNQIRYVWMWHEPMLIYRYKEKKVEKLIAWWLAAWIRLINWIDQIKSRELYMDDQDIMFIYSDWLVEARNEKNELLWVDWLACIFWKICEYNTKTTKIYDEILAELYKYKAWIGKFDDDATVMMMRRNFNRDILDKKSDYLKELTLKEWLSRKNLKELEWKTKEEIEKELEKIKRVKQTNIIIEKLENLYVTWEILILKQEAIRYIKEWFIHKKINLYLKKAIANEKKYKVNLKEQKMKNKYNVLKELMKKWDFQAVIRECNDIIAWDWNI